MVVVTLALLLTLAGSAAAAPAGRATTAAAACPGASVPAVEAAAGDTGRAIRCLVNAERAARGAAPVRASRPLRVAAEGHAADMVARGYFAHVSPGAGTLTDRADRAGYLAGARGWVVGENLAWGETTLSRPASIVAAWMRSPPHRDAMLDRAYREAGVGVAAGLPLRRPLPGATFVLALGARG